MTEFDPNRYGPIVSEILQGHRLLVLGPGSPNSPLRPLLLSLDVDKSFAPRRVVDPLTARGCLAGFWLWHDFLDESHAISQEIPTPEGSYWHAIMHRREPDAWNSKYWFRKVGSHSVVKQLAKLAPSLGYDYTDPFAFVDFVESVRGAGSAEEELARRVQKLEWELLFDWCFQRAFHG